MIEPRLELELRLGGARTPFAGPLDLLLALVRRGGYPLDQLPVARLTGQFLAVAAHLRSQLGAEEDGEAAELLAAFTETASWLVLLKSRALLPPAPTEEAEPAAAELGRALLGHAALQQAAGLLRERLEETGLAAGAPAPEKPAADQGLLAAGPPPTAGAPPSAGPGPTIADAVASARRALDAIRARPLVDPYPMAAELTRLEAQLAATSPGKAVPAAPWFAARPEPAAQAALLLALLELARRGRLLLHQSRDFAPLWLKRIER